MLLSMTGQGSAHIQAGDVKVAAELRTVNNRYYKLSLRMTEGYTAFEPSIDELVRRVVRRGTVQLDVRIERQSSPDDYRLNEVALLSYAAQVQRVRLQLGLPGEVSIESLAMLPDVHEQMTRVSDVEAVWPAVERAIGEALDGLTRMRHDEGRAMRSDLSANLSAISAELDAIETLAPKVVAGYRARLNEKLDKLLGELGVAAEKSDVVREVGLFAERTDIAEEIVRLRSHLEQFATIMDATESSGRKLDFITQEMFREANTIGSKANDAQIARHVVEIKTAIERIREMIQNVE